jgi:DNA-binding beta-propeller fold protein YncE
MFSRVRSLFVTSNGDIYVDGDLKGGTVQKTQVHKWPVNAESNQLIMDVRGFCYGLFVDLNNTLYCSLRDHHQVLKKSLNTDEKVSISAVGNGSNGSALNMLDRPHGIFVTSTFDLYVADSGNNRILLFKSGQSNGTTLSNKTAIKNLTLNFPTGIVLDADKNLFIVDSNNHRIVRKGSDGFLCLVGCSNKQGSSSDALSYPRSLSFDSYGNMFVVDNDNNRVQKFLLASNFCSKCKLSVNFGYFK